MLRRIGRAQLIVITAILALFFTLEFAMNGFAVSPRQQAQGQLR